MVRQRQRVVAVLVAAFMIVSLACTSDVAGVDGLATVRYVHDELGRLATVLDREGNVARYRYDEAGNITAVTREVLGAPGIADFSPRHGRAGDEVSLFGRGFAPAAADNTVLFDGRAAAVRHVAAGVLVVEVPAGAGSGPVTVKVGGGSGVSAGSFRIDTDTRPVVTGLDRSIVTIGDRVTATGVNLTPGPEGPFAALNSQRLALTDGGPTSYAFTVPTAGSGRLSTWSAGGRSTGPDLFVAPTGTTAAQVDEARRVEAGQRFTATLTQPGKLSLYVFDAAVGDRVAIDVRRASLAQGQVSLVGPDGTRLVNRQGWGGASGQYVEFGPVVVEGSYTVVIESDERQVGTADVLVSRSVGVTAALTLDAEPVTVTTTVPGQNARFTYRGQAGQRVAFVVDVIQSLNDRTEILAPGGAKLWTWACCGPDPRFTDVLTLPESGEYTVVVDVAGSAVGPIAARVFTVAPDAVAPLTAGGPEVEVTTTTAGQNAAFTFEGVAGQRVSLTMSVLDTLNDRTVLRGPDGAEVWAWRCCNDTATQRFTDVVTLPASGTYTLVVDPAAQKVGALRARLHTVPLDAAGSLTPGGPEVALTTTAPGQNAAFTFEGVAGQRVSLTMSVLDTLNDRTVLRGPDGAEVWAWRCCNDTATQRFTDVVTLPAPGRYTLVTDPARTGIGALRARLFPVPVDVSGSVTAGGPEVVLTTTAPGQNAAFTFAGSAGQRVSMTASVLDRLKDKSVLRAPDGTTVWAYQCCSGTGTQHSTGVLTLPATGTYTLAIDPAGTGVGALRAKLTEESVAPASARAGTPAAGGLTGSTSAEVDDHRADRRAPGADAEPWRRQFEAATTDANLPTWWRPSARPPRQPGDAAPDPSPWADLIPYTAPAGVSAVAGQVLRPDGLPLAGITIEADGARTVTDRSGRFVVSGVASGHVELVFDGLGVVDGDGTQWGRFELGVEVVAGRTTILDHTTWMPAVDKAHLVKIPRVLDREVVLTHPDIPLLEVHIPAGSWIDGEYGEEVTELGITPIDVDRPPFPLPTLGVNFPRFFLVQPGASYVYPRGAQVVYPNYTNLPPGERTDFWNYSQKDGWFSYGKGTVTPDGRQVVPDPGTRIYEFTGASMNAGNQPPDLADMLGGGAADGDPVSLATGLFVEAQTDLVLPGALPLALTRTYRQNDSRARSLGVGTTLNYDMFLWSAHQHLETDLILPDGGKVHFRRTSPGTGPSGAEYLADPSPTVFRGARIHGEGTNWVMTLVDGTVINFPWTTPPNWIRDRFGNELHLIRDQQKRLVRMVTSEGRWVRLSYEGPGTRIVDADDNSGRNVHYGYDASGRLTTVRNPKGETTTYAYDAAHRMTSITDARGITYLRNEYDGQGRVVKQTQADGGAYQLAYTADTAGRITATTVTDPRGMVREADFTDGYLTRDVLAKGTPEQQITTYERDASHAVTAEIDTLGRRSAITYDARGNVAELTRLAGTPDARTTRATYNERNDVASVTDALGRTITYGYDDRGARREVVTPAGRTQIEVDATGQPARVIDALGHATRFERFLGDVVATVDPLGRRRELVLDGAGRRVAATNPLGDRTVIRYDALGNPVAVVDELGHTTAVTRDANSNVTSVVDRRRATTANSYDVMDRVERTTDPLGRATTFAYDAGGLLTRTTDRRGTVATQTYDALGRRTASAHGDTRLAGYRYDGANRLVEIDAPTGKLSWGYNDADDVLSETTAAGTVAFSYDKAGQRTQMTVPGQPATNYAYDGAGRLTSVSRADQRVTLSYDPAGRPSRRQLPNGVTVQYGWDEASQLTKIVYKRGDVELGNLAYGYDRAGRRNAVAGSLARAVLPPAVASATYDAANRLTRWGDETLEYDAEGNLVRDGANTYSWDTRNQLVAIGGAAPATFAYDDLGRRTRATIAGRTTSYVYEGPNVARQQQGATTVDLLNGLERDARYTRTAGGVTQSLLLDGLGSTVGLVGPDGTLGTSYVYDAFGGATASGAPSDNEFRFAGREDDGTGLVHMRARMYSPRLGRFISEDPIGVAGGDENLYAYVGSNPTTSTDSTGLFIDTLLDVGFIAYDVYQLATGGRKHAAENLAALGADILGAMLPGVTGLGSAARAGKVADRANDARRMADKVGDTARGFCTRSFSPDTEVVMADGSRRPIDQVRAGDRVLAADPETGVTSGRQVTGTAVMRHRDDLLDVTVIDADGDRAVIRTTDHHPFWSVSDGRWEDAADLRSGERLRQVDGGTATVAAVAERPGSARMHDLSVAVDHDFFVAAGEKDAGVLVHNVCVPDFDALSRAGQAPSKNGMTRSGYEYQKHAARGELPKVTGNPRNFNEAGQNLLDDILTDPATKMSGIMGGNFAGGTRFVRPDGVGAAFDAAGNFQYFLSWP